jgi:hypothetical protein
MDAKVIVNTGNGETAALADVGESSPAAVDGAQEAGHQARINSCNELHHQRRGATVETVQAKLRELRERLRHLVQC